MELVIWLIPTYFSSVKSWRNIESGLGFKGPRMEEHNLLPNETRSYNHIHQRETGKEKIVPLVLMDWHLPRMPSLMKSHKPDNGNFSAIEAQSNMKCLQ